MKKKTFRIMIIAWLILLSIFSAQDNQRLNWLENQYDNVILTLIEK